MASALAPTIPRNPFGEAAGLLFAAAAAAGRVRRRRREGGRGRSAGGEARGEGRTAAGREGRAAAEGFFGKGGTSSSTTAQALVAALGLALGLGVGVNAAGAEGLEYFRWLALFLGGAWLMFLLFFRIFRSGGQRKIGTGAAKLTFVAMNYLMKDLYQAMLFFLLPFYWKSSTWGSINFWFAVGWRSAPCSPRSTSSSTTTSCAGASSPRSTT